MCGRINVIDDPLCQIVCEQLGLNFTTATNPDLRPTQMIACVSHQKGQLTQSNLSWGIKPDWAKRIIINAQAETVSHKPTFANAFQQSRVVVPCTGWYEWREEQGTKVKYLFTAQKQRPLYMAGIELGAGTQVVTLTTKPTKQCSPYHHRMPLLIDVDDVTQWISASPQQAYPLLNKPFTHPLSILAC